ncbi:MAG: hypothetical protein V4494_01840 [Chlamydiota bacterium]
MLCLSSCAPNSLEDYQKEGDALCRKLVKEFQQVHSREELVKVMPHLKKEFENLVDLVVEARVYQANHPEDGSLYEGLQSEALRAELQRIYALEGGRVLIEEAQHEALLRLDVFEKNFTRQLLKGK